jgi:hypothetical protein
VAGSDEGNQPFGPPSPNGTQTGAECGGKGSVAMDQACYRLRVRQFARRSNGIVGHGFRLSVKIEKAAWRLKNAFQRPTFPSHKALP